MTKTLVATPDPYTYTDPQNHRLTITIHHAADDRPRIVFEADSPDVGGDSVNAWLPRPNAETLADWIEAGKPYSYTDHAGDRIDAVPGPSSTTVNITRADLFGDALPTLISVVVLTERVPELVRAIRAHLADEQPRPAADPIAYGPTGYRCGCGKDAHSNLSPCTPADEAFAAAVQAGDDAIEELTATLDGRDALAFVIIRPGDTPDTITIEAGSRGLSKADAARVLREVARQWSPEPTPPAVEEPAVPAVGDRYVSRHVNRIVTVTRVWTADDGSTGVAYEWRDDRPGQCSSACPLDVFHREYRPATAPSVAAVTVTAAHVEAALRGYLAHLDYDLSKTIECGEDTGEDTYPAEAADLFDRLADAVEADTQQ